ncbi:hypothetical protein K435DRAFT_880010 [Dendrothele bispora CBS 962.96]|uniref:Uncharacterized protein n=1 Tax=Dendrothele bispora (strain CBS 962.96) TaxID=1314807 RepID=A0A4S8KK63_DENBC|nr:hypothetical protein K435DRAFT_880010 [Dendrothele bispora CBS 962.96]
MTDSSPGFNGTYPEPIVRDLFYSSNILASDSNLHAIGLESNGPFLYFDYAVVTVTELEKLQGQTIIVDDSNTEIKWEGDWEERSNYTLDEGEANFNPVSESQHLVARPHGNSTHESDNVGDYFVFQFQGTSILVAGITPLNRTDKASNAVESSPNNFHLKLNFTLDGYSQSVVFTNEGLPQPVGTPHFIYFQNESLVEGNHTLIMTLDDVTGNTSVVIDYLTYQPSFATLKDKPVFPSIPISSNFFPTPSSSRSPGPKFNISAIAGGVVGGVVFLGLLALSIWLLLYKKKQQVRRLDQHGSMDPHLTLAMSDLIIEPFLLFNPTHTLPRKVEPSILPVQSPPVAVPWARNPAQHAELSREQRAELEETVQNLEFQGQRGDTRGSDQNLATQDQMREVLARIDILTGEMSRYIDPPDYNSR